MSQLVVRAALQKHLRALVGADMGLAMENSGYSPVVGQPYLRVRLMPATPDNSVAGSSYFETGVFEVQAMYPKGIGSGEAEAMAQSIRNHFRRMTMLNEAGVNVLVMATPAIAQGMPVDDRFAVPVSVTYRAQINP